MRRLWGRMILGSAFAAAVGALLVAGTGVDESGAPVVEDAEERFHAEPAALRDGVVEATAALLRDDAAAVRSAVERIQAGGRPPTPEVDEIFGEGFHVLNLALDKVLRGTRSYAASGDVEEAFNEFIWVQRTCRQCHAVARERGFLPATGPLWFAAESGPERAETTQLGEKTP